MIVNEHLCEAFGRLPFECSSNALRKTHSETLKFVTLNANGVRWNLNFELLDVLNAF
jgi:hypothetical protein